VAPRAAPKTLAAVMVAAGAEVPTVHRSHLVRSCQRATAMTITTTIIAATTTLVLTTPAGMPPLPLLPLRVRTPQT